MTVAKKQQAASGLEKDLAVLKAAQKAFTEDRRPGDGALDPAAVLGSPVALAAPGKPVKKPGFTVQGPVRPGDNPIAVISRDGSVYPFSGEPRDRIALLGYDVTYIYRREDLKKVLDHNQRVLRDGNVDQVIHGEKMVPPPASPEGAGDQLRESLAVAFDPAMLAQ